MNRYKQLRDKQSQEFGTLQIFFAFNSEQFEEGMKKLGLQATDTDKIYKLGSTGGFYRKSYAATVKEMFERHVQEMNEAMKDDQFLYDMFSYELANHEYGYTYDLFPVLEACGLTYDEVKNDQRLSDALKNAQIDYLEINR